MVTLLTINYLHVTVQLIRKGCEALRLGVVIKVGTDAGTPADQIKRINVARVLQAIHWGRHSSRVDIASALALNPATASRAVTRLLGLGLVREFDPQPNAEVGRRKTPLAVDSETYVVVGVHAGLLRTTVGLVSLHGQMLSGTSFDHRATPPREAIAAAAEWAKAEVRTSHRLTLGVGLAMHGHRGEPGGSVPGTGLTHDEARRVLGELFPGATVRVDPVSTADALAQYWWSPDAVRSGHTSDAQEHPTHEVAPQLLLYLYVAALPGVALLDGGMAAPGSRGLSGNIDHLQVPHPMGNRCECGLDACFLANVGNIAVIDAASRISGRALESLREVVDLAETEPAVRDLLRRRAENIVAAARVLDDLIEPDRFVLGGDAVARSSAIITELIGQMPPRSAGDGIGRNALHVIDSREESVVRGPAALVFAELMDKPEDVTARATDFGPPDDPALTSRRGA